MLAGIAELTARNADQLEDALDAEQWASTVLGMLRDAPLPAGEDAESMFLPELRRLRSRSSARERHSRPCAPSRP